MSTPDSQNSARTLRGVLRSRAAQRRVAQRRGVLLLVVLSLLTLFLLVGTAFLIVAGQYRTSAKAVEKKDRTSLQPGDLVDRALRQILRDTGNPNSVLRQHSLLRDMYGTDGFVAKVYVPTDTEVTAYSGAPAANPNLAPRYASPTYGAYADSTSGQLIDIFIEEDLNPPAPLAEPRHVLALETDPQTGLPVNIALPRTDGYFNGCLLTMLAGPARGQSTRIIDYRYEPALGNATRAIFRVRVVAFPRVEGTPLTLSGRAGGELNELIEGPGTVGGTFIGHTFMVNGRAFNGTGVGLNPLANNGGPRLNTLELFPAETAGEFFGAEQALLPNAVYFDPEVAARYIPTIDDANYATAQLQYQPLANFELLNKDLADDGLRNGSVAEPSLYERFAGPGGEDESYDAPDFQNMALAHQTVTPRGRGRVVDATGVSQEIDAYQASVGFGTLPARLDLEDVPLPSYHRPELVNYWFHRLLNAPWLTSLIADPQDRAKAILRPYDASYNPQYGLNAATAARVVAIKRRCMLRPLPEDHPDFDGSNPLSQYRGTYNPFDPSNATNDIVSASGVVTAPTFEVCGPWDVDNDGDGVADSVWVDLGDPVVSMEDGRRYKPMYAILVQDMDGRLNLNAHGSAEHFASVDLDSSSTGYNLAGAVSSDLLPHGAGWGPAEVSLRGILSPNLPNYDAVNGTGFSGDWQADDYARLLTGRPGMAPGVTADEVEAISAWGRHGAAAYSGAGVIATPGVPFDLRSLNTVDRRTPYERFDVSAYDARLADRVAATGLGSAVENQNFNALVASGAGYGSSADFAGRYGVALDFRGQPIAESSWDTYDRNPLVAGWQPSSLLHDSPYELDLMNPARRGAVADPALMVASYTSSVPVNDDAPFAPTELERLLRAYDADAPGLPDRLWNLVNAFDPNKLAVQEYTAPLADTSAFVATPAQLAAAQITAAANRRAVTTDSFDVPANEEHWAGRLLNGADGLPGVPQDNDDGNQDDNDSDGDGDSTEPLTDDGSETISYFDPSGNAWAGRPYQRSYDDLWGDACDDYVVVMRESPPTQPRLVDYLRYRVTLELKKLGLFAANLPASDPTLSLRVNLILRGDNGVASNLVRTGLASFGGLLAPETLAGMKLDLNRPFGDGRDNNGNGVVDEPQEAGEPYVDSNNNGVWDDPEPYLDLDGDGRFYADTDNDGSVDTSDWILSSEDYNANGTPDRVPPFDSLWPGDSNGDDIIGAGEFTLFEHAQGQDATGRGAVTPGGQRIVDDNRMARQLYARHLYCLMLLLVDENYLAPWNPRDYQEVDYIDPDSAPDRAGAPNGPQPFGNFGSPAWHIFQAIKADTRPQYTSLSTAQQKAEARRLALRKLTCRKIAQWAANVVDLRDPDAIMTEFEYDENPWDGWNVVDRSDAGGDEVYPIDGDLTTDENQAVVREVLAAGFGAPTVLPAGNTVSWLDQTRGVVWGAERPELLITETLAFHDRRLEDRGDFEDTSKLDEVTDSEERRNFRIADLDEEGNPKEDDLDQRLKPQGSGFVELHNPWSVDGQLPAELYQTFDENDLDGDGNFTEPTPDVFDIDGDGNTTESAPMRGVVLDRLTPAVSSVKRSPVWRVIAVEEHPWLRNGDIIDGSPKVAGEGTEGGEPAPNDPAIYQTLKPGTDLRDLANKNRGDVVGWSEGQPHPQPTLLVDPDFPTFRDNVLPTVSGVLPPFDTQSTAEYEQKPISDRLQFFIPRQYVEREFYFTSGNSNLAPPEDPNFNLRIPLRYVQVPMGQGLIPADWELKLRTEASTLLWPEGMDANRTIRALRIYTCRFPPRQRDLLSGTATQDIAIAPVMPGRYAVVGSMGFVYLTGTGRGGVNPTKEFPSRCMSTLGRLTRAVGTPDQTSGDDLHKPQLTRRIEMMPSPNPEAHQVTVALNAGNESALVDLDEDGFYELNATDMGAIANTTTNPNPFNRIPDAATANSLKALRNLQPSVAIPIRGMSFSTPLDGYLLREIELSRGVVGNHIWRPTFARGEGEYSGGGEAKDEAWPFDEPFDLHRSLVENRTTPNWRSVHLQRLANPLLPWNPAPGDPQHLATLPVNPYRTLDSAPVDLTAFNGTDLGEKDLNNLGTARRLTPNGSLAAPDDLHRYRAELPEDAPRLDNAKPFQLPFLMTFSSLERGFHGTIPDAGYLVPERLLWGQEPANTLPDLKAIRLTGANRLHDAGGNPSAFVYQHKTRPPVAVGSTKLPWPAGVTFENDAAGVSPLQRDLDGDGSVDLDDLTPQQHVFDYPIRHTLGYLNAAFGAPYTLQSIEDPVIPLPDDPGDLARDGIRVPLGGSPFSVGIVDVNGDGIQGDLIGAPHTGTTLTATHGWLGWPNRPFSGPGELLQVPASAGGRLLQAFTAVNPTLPNPNPYKGDWFDLNRPNLTNRFRLAASSYPFGHLLNFFESAASPAASSIVPEDNADNPTAVPDGDVIPAAGGAAGFHRLFSYVRVPSPFTGVRTRFNPAVFSETNVTAGAYDPRRDQLAPSNVLEGWREPGRVNLNTASSRRTPEVLSSGGVLPVLAAPAHWSDAYDGLMHRSRDLAQYVSGGIVRLSHLGPAWRDVLRSRRGYGDPFTTDLSFVGGRPDVSAQVLHPFYPTFFARPFRGSDEGDLAPIRAMVHIGAESSILRSHAVSPGPDGGWGNTHRAWFNQANPQRDSTADVLGDDAMIDAPYTMPGGTGNSGDGLVDNPREAGAGDDTPFFAPSGVPLPVTFANPNPANPNIPRVPLFSDSTKGAPIAQTRATPARYSFPRMFDGERNPAVYYNPITRLSSLSTCRSGVYAIWITVGFFEVKQAPQWTNTDGTANTAVQTRFMNDRDLYDRVYPEGYTLGRELGSETGDITRKRAFYMVDRTLPVAFKPGEDVNIEKIILLERRIE